jgi:hypothetical protein
MLAYSPDLRRSPTQQNEDVSAKGGGPDAQHGGPLRPHLSEGQAAAVPDVCQEECVAVAMGSFLTAEGDYSGCGAQPPHAPHHILVRTCVQVVKTSQEQSTNVHKLTTCIQFVVEHIACKVTVSCWPHGMTLKGSILGCTSMPTEAFLSCFSTQSGTWTRD